VVYAIACKGRVKTTRGDVKKLSRRALPGGMAAELLPRAQSEPPPPTTRKLTRAVWPSRLRPG